MNSPLNLYLSFISFKFQAGSASVHLHMMSDRSKNLFNRAILMSGYAYSHWVFTPPEFNYTERLAKKLGWKGSSDASLLRFLESASAKEIVLKSEEITDYREHYGLFIIYPFGPVIEQVRNQNTFIYDDIKVMAKTSWSKNIDCIMGVTSFEALQFAILKDTSITVDTFNKDSAYFAPLIEFKLHESSEKAKKYGENIKKLYINDKRALDDLPFYEV